jgi:hypothetical protein
MTDKPKLGLVAPSPTPNDALDIQALWLDSALGDGLSETSWAVIPVGKPKDFFRVHPDPAFRPRAEIYAHKTEGQIDTAFYILGPEMRGRLEEARPCVLVTCIYRDGSPRLWPIMFPRDGEKDNDAWSTARGAARTAIDKWVRLVWNKRTYLTRDAQPGYAPEPDWGKIPSLDDMVRAAFGPHGIIQDTNHPIYRELMGMPAVVNDGNI